MTHLPSLWQPFTLGDIKLEHRLAMAPMTRSRATPEGVLGDINAEYYAQRASIDLAQEHDVEQFAFFSVLHPFISALRHHWNKMLVQEYLVDSGVPYTILQPTMFMRSPQQAAERGVMAVPWDVNQPMSVVDLEEVAEVAVKVQDGHIRAIYDLVGDQPLSTRKYG